MVRAVAAEVGQQQLDVEAPAQTSPQPGGRPQRLRLDRQQAGLGFGLGVRVEGHVLEPGPFGIALALGIVLVLPSGVVRGRGLPAVVGELVIIPDRHQRRLAQQLLKQRVAAVAAIQLSVVVQTARGVEASAGPAEFDGPSEIVELQPARAFAFLKAGIAQRLVDEIAQMQQQIGRVLEQRQQGVVPTTDIVLATECGQAQGGHRRRVRRGPRATARRGQPALLAFGEEAVIPAQARFQPAHTQPRAAVVFDRSLEHDIDAQALEPGILGDLDPQSALRMGRGQPGPQHEAVCDRIARGHALRKQLGRGSGPARRPGLGQQQYRRAGQHGLQEQASVRHRRIPGRSKRSAWWPARIAASRCHVPGKLPQIA